MMQNTILLTTTIDNYSITSNTDEIEKYADMIKNYGPATVIIAVFIFVFLSILLVIVKNTLSVNKQIMKQQEELLEKMMEEKDNKDKVQIPVKEKNIIEVFVKIDDSIKNILRKISDNIDADRLSVYVFHNGVYSSHGLPFFKASCISEITKGCEIAKKVNVHNNLPLSIFDDIIKALYKDGKLSMPTMKFIKNKYPAVYNMMIEAHTKSASIVAIYDNDGNILGGIVAEFVEEKEESELESITEVLSKEAPYLSPILEFSDYRDLN